MSRLHLLLSGALLSVVIVSPHTLSAQATPALPAKPGHRQVQTSCPQCVERARSVNRAYDALSYLWDRKLSLMKQIAIVESVTAERAVQIERLEQATPRSGRSLQQQRNIDTLRTVNEQQRGGLGKLRRDLAEIDARIAEEEQIIATRLAELAECEKQCAVKPVDPPLVADAGPLPQILSTPEGRLRIAVNCPACRPIARHIEDLIDERAEMVEEFELLETEFEVEEAGLSKPLSARTLRIGDRKTTITNDIEDVLDAIDELDNELRQSWDQLNRCVLACIFVPTSVFTKPWFYGPVIGAGGIGVLSTRGGSNTSAPPTATTPTTPQAPPVSTTPVTPPVTTPAPTPAPQPQISIDGTYKCSRCAPVSDEAQHNRVIDLCPQLVGDFLMRGGPLMLSHPMPFVPISGSDVNTTTGAFSGTGRGLVAGFPNVSVRGDGTFDPASRRVMVNYTMGTAGELPGGRSITYSITLDRVGGQ